MNVLNSGNQYQIISNVSVGKNVKLWNFINVYGCEIGDDTMVGTFVEIQAGAKIGKRCRIQSHSFICEAVTIEDDVFIGHGVMFINDNKPQSSELHRQRWQPLPVHIKSGTSIGSNATILGGVTIGSNVTVGAGAVVTKDISDNSIVAGVPARPIKQVAA